MENCLAVLEPAKAREPAAAAVQSEAARHPRHRAHALLTWAGLTGLAATVLTLTVTVVARRRRRTRRL